MNGSGAEGAQNWTPEDVEREGQGSVVRSTVGCALSHAQKMICVILYSRQKAGGSKILLIFKVLFYS